MELINLTKTPAPLKLLVSALKPTWNFKGFLIDSGLVPLCQENDVYFASFDINDVFSTGLNIEAGQFLLFNGDEFEIKELTVEASGGGGLDYVSTWRSCPTVDFDGNATEIFEYPIPDLEGDRYLSQNSNYNSSQGTTSYGGIIYSQNGFKLNLTLASYWLGMIDITINAWPTTGGWTGIIQTFNSDGVSANETVYMDIQEADKNGEILTSQEEFYQASFGTHHLNLFMRHDGETTYIVGQLIYGGAPRSDQSIQIGAMHFSHAQMVVETVLND